MYNVLLQALTRIFLFLSLMWDRCNILHFSFLRERWGREKGKRPSRWGLALHELSQDQLPWTLLHFPMSQTIKVYSSNRSSTWLFQNIVQGSCCLRVVLASHGISPVLKSHLHMGFAASGGQGRSENAVSELLSLSHKSLLPWGLISQSKSPGHGWLTSWILHMVSEGEGNWTHYPAPMTSTTAGQVGRTTQMWGLCALTLSKARVWKGSLKQDQKQAWRGGKCQMPQGSFYHAPDF